MPEKKTWKSLLERLKISAIFKSTGKSSIELIYISIYSDFWAFDPFTGPGRPPDAPRRPRVPPIHLWTSVSASGKCRRFNLTHKSWNFWNWASRSEVTQNSVCPNCQISENSFFRYDAEGLEISLGYQSLTLGVYLTARFGFKSIGSMVWLLLLIRRMT